ncbi:MAG: YlcI/YnfO family protein [Enterobacteriaceae bacterium]
MMKTATLPSLRVSPELRSAAEAALHQGESLSNFIEEAVKKQIEYRQSHELFIQRAMNSRNKAKESGEYRTATEVLSTLATKLSVAQGKTK